MSLLTYGELFCGKKLLLGIKGQEMTGNILTWNNDKWKSTELGKSVWRYNKHDLNVSKYYLMCLIYIEIYY